MPGKLLVIPTVISDRPPEDVLPGRFDEVINQPRYFIVENVRTARRFLKKAGISKAIDDLTFYEIDKHAGEKQFPGFLKPAMAGEVVGLLSEAGQPCIADPGSTIVRLAHERDIIVRPVTGPSSIFLALAASGLNGQNFAFNGYLPIERGARVKKIRELEKRVLKENQTQIFMEAPYRNNKLVEDVLNACNPSVYFSIASDITGENEQIKTCKIAEWKNKCPNLHKIPAIFMIGK